MPNYRCPRCGKEIYQMSDFCPYCGESLMQLLPPVPANQNAYQNSYYGAPYQQGQQYQQYGQANPYQQGGYPPPGGFPYAQKSKIAAGILGILFGCWGVHNFYLGYYGRAIAQLSITAISLIMSFVGVLLSWLILPAILPFIGLICILGVVVWALVESILIFAGSIKDSKGNPLI